MEKKSPPRPSLQRLADLDLDLLRLVRRRCQCLAELRRTQASPAQGGQQEKYLREAWEREAARMSRDPRLTRRLFSLLQEIELAPAREDGSLREAFNLSPSLQPVDIAMPGVPSRLQVRLRLALAAAFGAGCQFSAGRLGDDLLDFMRALNHAGARLEFNAESGLVSATAGEAASFAEKAVHVGDSAANFYFLSALALAGMGKVKFLGGGNLKIADFSVWRHMLPQLGARLASLVPRADGLPAREECSGVFQPVVTIDARLPRVGVTALVATAATWGVEIRLEGALNPSFEAVLDELCPALAACGVCFERAEGVLAVSPGAALPDEAASLPLDPFLTAVSLAFPVMAGGRAAISGRWEKEDRAGQALLDFLSACGLEWRLSRLGLEGRKAAGLALAGQKEALAGVRPDQLAEAARGLDTAHLPLTLPLLAAVARQSGSAPLILQGRDGGCLDAAVVEDFLGRLGYARDGACLVPAQEPAAETPWSSPDAIWAMAFSLGAYLRPNRRLANPGVVASLVPLYWQFYNSLPVPFFGEVKKPAPQAAAKTARRRVIASETGTWPEEKEEDESR